MFAPVDFWRVVVSKDKIRVLDNLKGGGKQTELFWDEVS